MKLKPLGKKLAVYQATAIASFIGLPIAFHFGWAAAFCICLVAFIFSGSQALSILIDANYSKYGLFGMRGPDTLIEYEPGDKDYETEKHWQNKLYTSKSMVKHTKRQPMLKVKLA